MKIAVNLTYLTDGKQPVGIDQFALNLFKGMQAIGKLDNFHLFVAESFYEKGVCLFPEAEILPIAAMDDFYNLNKYHRFLKSLYIDRYLVPYFLKKARYNLLYHPFNGVNDYISNEVPTLITIHDLFFKNYPEEINNLNLKYMKYRYKDLIYKTNHIVVPSQFVKQDIMKYYPDAELDRITVINNPVSVTCEKTSEFAVIKPYLLCVNSISNHKNLITLLKAFQLIQDKVEHYLVLTGAQGDTHINLEQYAAKNHIKKLIMTDYVTDEHRNYLYQNADLFISPSLHEGFGMTPVEAALFEIPVLTTRETSIPEVTRNMVNYYEPAEDSCALAAQIMNLLDNKPPKSELELIKKAMAQEYDPERIAALYFDLFERVSRR